MAEPRKSRKTSKQDEKPVVEEVMAEEPETPEPEAVSEPEVAPEQEPETAPEESSEPVVVPFDTADVATD